MRVHGTLKIKRRDLDITDWSQHKPELEEDFFCICGYCGKHFKATLCDSQIEHFIPKKKYPEYENKYSNLILACKVCNNKKRSDWPSNDPLKNITDDGKKGYVDPATDEFDNHLERLSDGNIIGKTEIGKYMSKRLGFSYRPISEIQKIKELYDAIQLLRDKKAHGDSSYDTELFNDMLLSCEDLRQQIHMKKE
jgi:uncharacterized protein (TIGR02646 family)